MAFGGSNPSLPTAILATVKAWDVLPASRLSAREARVDTLLPKDQHFHASCQHRSSECGCSSTVELQPSKLEVAGSNPVARSGRKEQAALSLASTLASGEWIRQAYRSGDCFWMDDLRSAIPGGEKAGLTAIGSVRGNQEGRPDELVRTPQPVTLGCFEWKSRLCCCSSVGRAPPW